MTDVRFVANEGQPYLVTVLDGVPIVQELAADEIEKGRQWEAVSRRLHPFIRHSWGCYYLGGGYCDCGFADALAAFRELADPS